MAVIEERLLAAWLQELEDTKPGVGLILAGERPTGEIIILDSRLIGQWIGRPSFPRTIDAGFLQSACLAAEQLVAEGEFVRWNVCEMVAPADWKLHHTTEDSAGHKKFVWKGLRWKSVVGEIARLEESLPALRRAGHLEPGEGEPGRPISLAKSNARDALHDALEELADLYERSGSEQKAAQVWEELGPMKLESLTVAFDGVKLVATTEDGRAIDVTPSRKLPWWQRLSGR